MPSRARISSFRHSFCLLSHSFLGCFGDLQLNWIAMCYVLSVLSLCANRCIFSELWNSTARRENNRKVFTGITKTIFFDTSRLKLVNCIHIEYKPHAGLYNIYYTANKLTTAIEFSNCLIWVPFFLFLCVFICGAQLFWVYTSKERICVWFHSKQALNAFEK